MNYWRCACHFFTRFSSKRLWLQDLLKPIYTVGELEVQLRSWKVAFESIMRHKKMLHVSLNKKISVLVDAADWHFYQSDGCNQTHPDLNHRVLLVGYDSDPELGNYSLVRNSWKPWWEPGRIRLRRTTTSTLDVVSIWLRFDLLSWFSNHYTFGKCGIFDWQPLSVIELKEHFVSFIFLQFCKFSLFFSANILKIIKKILLFFFKEMKLENLQQKKTKRLK